MMNEKVWYSSILFSKITKINEISSKNPSNIRSLHIARNRLKSALEKYTASHDAVLTFANQDQGLCVCVCVCVYVCMRMRMRAGVCVYLSVCGRGLPDDTEHMEPKILWQEAGLTGASDLNRSPSVEPPAWFTLSRKLRASGIKVERRGGKKKREKKINPL